MKKIILVFIILLLVASTAYAFMYSGKSSGFMGFGGFSGQGDISTPGVAENVLYGADQITYGADNLTY